MREKSLLKRAMVGWIKGIMKIILLIPVWPIVLFPILIYKESLYDEITYNFRRW